MEQISIRKTTGDVFTHGMIELVIDPIHDGQLTRLFWKEEVATIAPRIKIDRKTESEFGEARQTFTYEPEDLKPTFLRAMRFPSRSVSFGSTQQLLDGICGVIKKFTNLGNDHASLAARTVLASWFVEATDCPVSLVLYGPACPQCERLFRILSCLYRRALFVGEINLASLCALPLAFSPSLFFEGCDHSPRIQKVIRATSTRGYIPSKGKLVTTRCATVIYSEEPLNGVIPDISAVEIPVMHTRVPLPPLNGDALQIIPDEFQPKLPMYRLVKCTHVLNSTFDAAPLTSKVNDLARSLATCVVDGPVQQANIVRLLRKKDDEVNGDWSWDLSVTVMEALLSLCNKHKQSVYVSEVANEANLILERRGEMFVMTARSVGYKLRVMGLAAGRMGSAGRGILLTREIQKRIHQMAWDSRLALQHRGENRCGDCWELKIEQDDEESRAQESDDIDVPGLIRDHPDPNDPF